MWFDSEGGGGQLVLIDDPTARVSVGPDAWLIMISSEADYVGTHEYEGASCHAFCGWCEQGQMPCQGGPTYGRQPRCNMCLPYDLPDAGDQCATFVAACLQGGEGEGLDETGGGTIDGMGEYDCTTWRPEEGVQRSGGALVVDAALVDEVFLYQGEPLASCDDTRFRARMDGYFEISKLGDHGLLPAMGLAQGDVILAVNDKALKSIDAVMEAASLLVATTSFTVTIDRGGDRFDMHVSVR